MMRKPVFCLLAPFLEDANLKKDTCLLPLVMQMHYGYHARYATYRAKDAGELFPSRLRYPEEVEFDYLTPSFTDFQGEVRSIFAQNQSPCSKDLAAYIAKRAKDIDVLYLFGFYPFYFKAVDIYKKKNPLGRVLLKLDANNFWVNNTPVNDPLIKFLKNCDVVAAESMVEYLSLKWPCPIHYLPNGYYDVDKREGCPPPRDFEKKENILFTAGRLGTAQKATEVLMEAFALAAPQLPDWKLVLAGEVDPAFGHYQKSYAAQHPELESRVIFTGQIDDKNELYEWYQKSKLFVLPSRLEGFSNALVEAKAHGCYVIASDLESNRDAVFPREMRGKIFSAGFKSAHKKGAYGSLFDVDNIQELETRMVEACGDDGLLRFVCGTTRQDVCENFNWVKICGRIDRLLHFSRRVSEEDGVANKTPS